MMPTAAALVEKLPRPLRRHMLMTGWMRLTGEDPLQLVRIRGDSFGYADMTDGFLRLIAIDGDFEADFFRIADALLANGGTFLDVGANHGLLSFGLAGRHTGAVRFHLFEPIPRLAASIEKTHALYPDMEMTLNRAAVADREEEVGFDVAEEQTGRSHIDPAGALKTPCLTLDDYLRRQGIEQVELLKLDVEGFELSALKGASGSLARHAVDAVYFEYFEKYLVRVGPPQELIGFLDRQGYVVCFCRMWDLGKLGPATHTLGEGLPGHGLPLLPVSNHDRPAMTDLLAIPRERLVAL
jgi:FkbM family methyltransferase